MEYPTFLCLGVRAPCGHLQHSPAPGRRATSSPGFTLSSSCGATSPRGRASPWEGSSGKPRALQAQPESHICKPSKHHLIGPSGPFEPAEGKVQLRCSAGRARFTQMEALAETTAKIPATDPFHTSEKRERNGRGRPKQTGFGKLEAMGWNFQLFLPCTLILGSSLRSEKHELSTWTLLGSRLLQKTASSPPPPAPVTKQALFPIPPVLFPWTVGFFFFFLVGG